MAVNEGDEATVSLVDVLEEDEELENEASAVLGGSDSERCSYPEEKDQLNADNKYSHNFFGLYCICNRPYPDLEDQIPDEMIQCIVCEDWFHGRHLGCRVAEGVEMQEMVCEACMNKAPFLWTYATHLAVKADDEIKEEKVVVKKEEIDSSCRNGTEEPSTSLHCQEEEKVQANGAISGKRKHQEVEGLAVHCRLTELEARVLSRPREGAVFWPQFWRSRLCTCTNCKAVYIDVGVPFLLDESDTVLAYENKGKTTDQEGMSEGRDPLMSALNTLDRVQQLEIIYEYNDMKTELKEYLQRFAHEGKVVTPEDIQRFFEQQQSRKRRRANAGQYYCS
ncbi:putative E3 ubiquitin-protein ligase UBR7 isoform X2 [Paramormyrops kingsleyae]|uniref:putative E3 ubiquitin-protein ligase UBR7 isoform X2 n=1 Tax=Paramormyrops kingsleyae TaxID=1676925 RepID=UPI003B978F72